MKASDLPFIRPSYVGPLPPKEAKPTYIWDDSRASEDFQYPPEIFLKQTLQMSNRARIVLCIGLYEWIIWRLRPWTDDPTPFHVAQAAWCGSIDQRYMRHYEFDREAWTGPIRGPLWCAMTWLIPVLVGSDNDPGELESGLSYLRRLADHVTSSDKRLEEWLEQTLPRLITYFPATHDDPFDDLFSHKNEQRRGSLVPKEILDPTFIWKPTQTKKLIRLFLSQVDYKLNPYLHDPSELSNREPT